MGLPVAAIAGAAGTISGLFPQNKDPERLERNAAAYTAALAGNREALRFLGQRGGILPPGNVSPAPWAPEGGTVGTWGSALAIDDAGRKYKDVVRRMAASPSQPPASPPASVLEETETPAKAANNDTKRAGLFGNGGGVFGFLLIAGLVVGFVIGPQLKKGG